jgi:hypothetical protein
MEIAFKIGVLLSLSTASLGCKSNESYVDMFSKLITNTSEVTISFGNRLDSAQVILDTTISDSSEVRRFKTFAALSGETEMCGLVSGTISFLQSNGEAFTIDFSLDAKCPVFYFKTEDKTTALRMSYQSGMYLSELQHLLSYRVR